MPIYEYQCEGCGKHHEVMQKITDAPLTVCPDCGGKMKKQISNTSFVLKGTGWYVTDYASDRKKGTDQGKKGEGVKSDKPAASEKKEAAKAEKKTASEEAPVTK
ncbi:MAG: zinc ribbon domain-containing protein [Candidatus Sulfobium sp.]|jgi:putative FmdB family regulatory protein